MTNQPANRARDVHDRETRVACSGTPSPSSSRAAVPSMTRTAGMSDMSTMTPTTRTSDNATTSRVWSWKAAGISEGNTMPTISMNGTSTAPPRIRNTHRR
jgi:hypothetical protein